MANEFVIKNGFISKDNSIVEGGLTANTINASGININGNLTVTGNTSLQSISGTTLDISGNTSSNIVKITQTGSGNAFVVEDSSNPDSSPFVIDASGNTGIGTLTPQAKLDVSGTTRITGSITSNTITEYFNDWRGTQNISSGLTPFSVTTHTLFAPTISSQATNLRPYALSIVPNFSGTTNTSHAVYISNTNTSPTSPGFNTSLVIRSSGTSEYGQYIDVSGSSTVGVYIDQAQTGQLITRTPSGGIGLSMNRNSTLEVAYTPINTFQQLSGTPSQSIFEYRNISSGNTTEINGLDLLNSSTGKFGNTLGNNAGINLRLGITNSSGLNSRYAKISAIAPNQTTLPDVIDLGLYVSDTGGTTTNAIYIKGSDQNVGIGTTAPTAKLHINNTTSGNTFLAEDDTNPDSTPFVIDASGNTGIGTLTPQYKLDVSGSSRVLTSMRVGADGNTFTSIDDNSIGISRTTDGLTTVILEAPTILSVNRQIARLRGREGVQLAYDIFARFQTYQFTSTIGLASSFDTSLTNDTSTILRLEGTKTPLSSVARGANFVPTLSATSDNDTLIGLDINPTFQNSSFTGVTNLGLRVNNGVSSFGGNVGIGLTGTTSPTAKLHINNTASGNTFLAEDDTNPDSSPFVIDASGNTGIGTLTPSAKLDVVGGNVALNNNVLYLGSNLGNQVLRIVESSNLQLFNSVGILYLNAGNSLVFGSNNSNAGRWATFFNTGNLLLQSGGTHTDAGFKLDVIGNTRVSGNTIISSGLSASTVTITTQPNSGYTSTQILMRNSTTGDVEITDSTSPSIYNYGMSYAMTTFNYLT
jgi:hypothetical protein